MTSYRNQSVRTLVAVAFSIGLLGFVDGIPTTWAAMPLAALFSAALLPELLKRSPLVAAGVIDGLNRHTRSSSCAE